MTGRHRWRLIAVPLAWVLAGFSLAAVAAVSWWHLHAPGAGPIRVGYWNQPPLYFAPAGRPPEGVGVDVLATAAKRLGIAVSWTEIDERGRADDAIGAGTIDIWPTSPVVAARPGMHITEPWLDSRFVLISRPDAVRDAGSLAGRTVALISIRYADAMFASALTGATRLVLPDYQQTLVEVCEGRADAALIEGRQVQWLLLNRPAQCGGVPLAFVPLPGAAILYGIGSSPAAARYADALRDEVSRMGEDGTLAGIHARWSLATGTETRLVYALQEARGRARLSLYGAAAIGLALLVSLYQVRRSLHARRLAEQASRTMQEYAQKQERYRILVERNVAGVVQSTVDGRILDCNVAFARMLGYDSKEEVLAVPAWQLYQDHADRRVMLDRLQEERTVSNQDVHVRRKDGSSGWLLESTSLVELGPDEPAILESTTIDNTEHRRLEEQYRQAQKLESVGRLAGGVAHDFNNLLTAINGYAELAMAELEPGTTVHSSVREISKAGHRAAGLTQQLLAFSRKQILQPVVMSLNDVVDDTRNLLERLIGEDIVLETRLAPSLGLVRADPGQVNQVVMNLAINARDAMPDGGTLTIDTSDVDLGADDDPDAIAGPCVRLRVRDTGHGMDAETRRRIFEPFFTTKERGKGTGLGLSTVYGIVKQSGGHIRVESAPGRGTTFEIHLPRVPEAGASDRPEPGRSGGARGTETILVVEDQEEVRRLVTEALTRRGFRVLVAADALAAMEICRREVNPVHLVVADVVMPGVSGPALVERLRADRPGLKVLFISGYGDEVVGGVSGQAAYLQKPFTPSQLVQMVFDSLADGRAGRSFKVECPNAE